LLDFEIPSASRVIPASLTLGSGGISLATMSMGTCRIVSGSFVWEVRRIVSASVSVGAGGIVTVPFSVGVCIIVSAHISAGVLVPPSDLFSGSSIIHLQTLLPSIQSYCPMINGVSIGSIQLLSGDEGGEGYT